MFAEQETFYLRIHSIQKPTFQIQKTDYCIIQNTRKSFQNLVTAKTEMVI